MKITLPQPFSLSLDVVHTHILTPTCTHSPTLVIHTLSPHYQHSPRGFKLIRRRSKIFSHPLLDKKIQQPSISFFPGSVADMSKASLKLRADIRATLGNFTFCMQELGRGGSSSGSASDYGSRGPRFESRWELGFFLFSSLSYLSISGAS